MTRMVHCVVLKKDAEVIERQPWPGEIGKRIYENVSKEAWQNWLGHQTMLINEYRLNALDPNARKFLAEEMEKFLFGEGSEKPSDFKAPE